ncbi:restriction endonuclease subunit S [Psychrobacter sp. M9-54-1]|uniref:restriction endonuclease subunit S n=1 Tax=Psychrobacter sp. M9-54-1 TaxID=2782386 RepID=UPI001909A240|nr:restriction endonuclease subunit S [Psychrobacter sp. M9-54-1]
MFINRVSPQDIVKHRIEAEYYSPEKMAQLSALSNLYEKWKSLDDLCEFITDGTHQTPNYTDKGIKFLSSTNIGENQIDFEKTKFVSEGSYLELKRTKCSPIIGDILISKNGKVGTASVYKEGHPEVGLFVSVALLRYNAKLDSDYVCVFLNSFGGQWQFKRAAKTGVITNLHLEEIREVNIPVLDSKSQQYIGEKVRQAEQLRAWAISLELNFEDQLKSFYPEAFKNKSTGKKYSIAPIEDVSYTLNPGAFDEERLRIRLYLKKCGAVKLKELAHIEGSTRSDYSQDTTYIGLDSISSKTCALSPSTISKSGVTGTSRILNEGVVVAKLRPYLNKISYIPRSLAGSVGSTELLCIRPKDRLNGWYIYGVLKSDIGLRQLKPLASGSTHPRIDQYDLYDLIFPVHQDNKTMGKWLENAQAAYFMASYLVTSAKTLVEALIEGQLTEEQLIQAQQALEDGDNTLDKAILSKLSSEGYAVEGAAPLFSDIDELYRLLASATPAADSED